MTTRIDSVSAATTPRRERRRKGVVILKFGLAGAALLGIAAAATSAAWSDDAWFSASAKGATVELQGALGASPAETDWKDADNVGGAQALTVDSTVFGDLLPGDHRTVTLNLRNTGSTKLTLGAPDISLPSSGDQILATAVDGTHAAVTVTGTVPSTIDPLGTAAVSLEITVPGGWVESNQGKAESFTVSFAGTAAH